MPMLLGLAIELASIITLLFIRETLGYNSQPDPQSLTTGTSGHDSVPTSPDITRFPDPVSSKQLRHNFLSRARTSLSFLTSDLRIPAIITTFGVHMLLLNRDVLLQYISTRYKTSLAYATALVSIRSGLVVVLGVIVLPAISLSHRDRLGRQRFDLVLARISAVLLAIGLLGIGLAPSLPVAIAGLVINSFGWGIFSVIRSLATSFVESHHVARLNSFIGVLDTVGLMIGSPLLAVLFAKGIELGGLLFGLPFLVLTAVVGIIVLILAAVSV